MSFVHPALTIAFIAVAIPLLIHLINMMRHRRVKWAAMEFLLASYKKHKKWIWLKQMLLLAMRMLAVAAVVAIMAQLIPPDQWAKLLGGKVTHHYVVLDDSLSMTDRAAGESAFDRAKLVVARLVERAAAEDSRQKLTLIRYSRAQDAATDGDAALVADVSDQPIEDGAWRESFDAQRTAMEASQLATGPEAALSVVANLMGEESDESRVVYVVSDFRERDWNSPARLDQQLQQLEKAGANVHLVDCALAQRPNLAITHLAPVEGTRSAGVPLFVTVSVKNFGEAAAENVELTVTSLAYENYDPARHGDDPAAIKPEPLDKRSETIESIPPGETVTRRIQVRFPITGKHVVEARLPDDAVVADNLRYAVVDFPAGEPVLIVDGHPDKRNAYYLTSVFQPQADGVAAASAVRTGISPTIEDAAKLRDLPLEALRAYRAVYLLDVPRLDEAAIAKLETYVREGGGLAIFLGDQTIPMSYNETLYKNGEGLLPLELGAKELLVLADEDVDDEERVPDFEVVDHPVLLIFSAGNPAFRRGVVISTFYEMAAGWTPPPTESAHILATLRDKASTPLIAEKQFGQGRVLAFNTSVAPLWNNWAREASFPATMLLLHGYIAAPLRIDQSQLVGTPVATKFSAENYQVDAKAIVPGVTPISRKAVALQGKAEVADGTKEQTLGVALASSTTGDVGRSLTGQQGIYEIWGARKTGELDVSRFALNVDPDEGDLAHVSPSQLAPKMQAKFAAQNAGDMQYELAGQSASNISEYLLYALVVLLIGEQLVAYSASYHPAAGGAR